MPQVRTQATAWFAMAVLGTYLTLSGEVPALRGQFSPGARSGADPSEGEHEANVIGGGLPSDVL